MDRLDIIIAFSIGALLLCNVIEMITEHIYLKRIELEREERINKKC